MEEQGKKLTKWLNKLQQESWQLELVVSGFAIFLMLGALDALENLDFMNEVKDAGLAQQGAILTLGFMILGLSCFFVLLNLIFHVMLRGLWISTLGLRYVSGDVDFDALRLAPRFDRFLRRRIGSFDKYILKLENLCSVVFAFTFLIVFMLLGFMMFLALLFLLIWVVENKLEAFLPDAFRKGVGIVSFILLMSSGLLYFIDFVTLGRLKRVRWFSVVYYPFYRFCSFITLASLYRPLYYNLVDNKFGRRVGILLVPYVVGTIFLLSFRIHSHVWFPSKFEGTNLKVGVYDDLRPEDYNLPDVTTPSKFVKNGYLEIFIRYHPLKDDDILEQVCPDFEPFREPGFGTDLVFRTNGITTEEKTTQSPTVALACFSKLYQFEVADSVFTAPGFYFYEQPERGGKGLLTILDLGYLSRGAYKLQVKKLSKSDEGDSEEMEFEDFMTIPFWKE